MNAPTQVPISITPEAAEHVAKLGMEAQFRLMIEHALQTIPDVRRVEVTLQPPYDTGDEDSVIIEVSRGVPYREDEPYRRQYRRWKISTFPPDVLRHFTLWIHHEAGHAG